MIDELVVRNLGVIESARVEPGPGLTVITGETGTGKTLLLGALRLLLGGDSRPELVGPFGEETVVEGRFVDAEGVEVGAGRRLPRTGRSRAYLDGSIASARALDNRAAGLVDIIGQHDHLSLTRPAEVRALVDGSLDSAGAEAADSYRRAWEALTAAEAARRELGGDRPALSRELDLVRFQSEEIAGAGLVPGDDEELEANAERLRHADEISEHLAAGATSIEAGREAMGEAVAALRRAAQRDGALQPLADALSANADAAGDLAHDVAAAGERVARDPERLELVESQLNRLGELRRKYGRTLEDVLAFGEAAARRRDELASLLGKADVIDDEVAAAEAAVGEAARALTEARSRAGDALAVRARGHLTDLGFSDPLVGFALEPSDPGPTGADAVAILFASDSRLAPGPVATVASGGELSRLVLALRLAGGSGEAETLVFDEVDAGIGGSTALALGRKLADLAGERQVLCVTHLPQVAAFADRHYVVDRDGTTASVRGVEGKDRLKELSRMLAGLPESDRGRDAAEELLEMAGRT
ncbi:MAG TPA: AAA family ATPase [Acidimicrobiia bacterium]|nr:AAA family ATPase [Acidimicrobiia bacterium]